MFRAASARMKVLHAPLIPQLECDLTLVIQPATRVEEPQQFHSWETAVITWDRWVHPYVFAFFLKLVIREGVTYFQLTASKALLQESSLHVRTFSRSEVLLGMGRVEEGGVLPLSVCLMHWGNTHTSQEEQELCWGDCIRSFTSGSHQTSHFCISFFILTFLSNNDVGFPVDFSSSAACLQGTFYFDLNEPAGPHGTMGSGLLLGISDISEQWEHLTADLERTTPRDKLLYLPPQYAALPLRGTTDLVLLQ